MNWKILKTNWLREVRKHLPKFSFGCEIFLNELETKKAYFTLKYLTVDCHITLIAYSFVTHYLTAVSFRRY